MKKVIATLLTIAMVIGLTACGIVTVTENKYKGAKKIVLSENSAKLDGKEIEEFDYTWHVDPSTAHDEVKDCPAEYYTGTKPETDAAAYIAHDIYYYPELDETLFQKVKYDDEEEYVYYYTNEEYKDFIFATLPILGNEIPTQMMHTEDEAYNNPVIHITQPGTYILEGKWHGQILIDLGDTDETFSNEEAKVTIVLNGVEVTCDCAPSFIAYSAYERALTIFEELKEDKEEFTGWVNWPCEFPENLFADIEREALRIREKCEVLVVVGIGGSYLGTAAVVQAIAQKKKGCPNILFAGNSLSGEKLARVIEIAKSHKPSLVCVSI